jgi:aspartate 1-decarboxylase
MSVEICTSKLHRVRVTGADLNYEGSITIDPLLMQAGNILPFQMLHINNISNAAHWETYAIPGTPGSGEVRPNGAPARLFHPGDLVVIMATERFERAEAAKAEQRVVRVNERNEVIRIEIKRNGKIISEESPPRIASSATV